MVRWWGLVGRRPSHVVDLEGTDGPVMVSGGPRRADDVLAAPVTGRGCLAYDWRAMAITQTGWLGGSRDRRLSVVDRDSDAVPFLVDDGTGDVLVDPAGAEFRLAEEFVADPADHPSGTYQRSALGGLLASTEVGPRRYYEGRLDEGETVVVEGHVRRDPDQRLVAGRIGASIGGGRTVVADAAPKGAARRSLVSALVALLAGGVVGAVLIVLVWL